MQQISLKAQKRSILGRKVKNLRKDGIIPAHVFGHKVKTLHVQVNAAEFHKVFDQAGETGIIDLHIDSEKKPVLVRNVQSHPVSDDPLHIDFYQVNLAEKVKVNVPLEIIGEAPAVEKKIGLLLTPITEVEVEALPADIPEKIEVDISTFANIGDEIKIKDLKLDRSKVEIQDDPEQIVAQIGELVTKEMEAVEAEIEADQAEAQVEEEAKQAEGEEESKTEEAQEPSTPPEQAEEEKPKEDSQQ